MHRLLSCQELNISPLSIPRIVEELKLSRGLQQCITHVEHFPAQDARYAGFPEGLDPLVIEVFKKRGIEQLYTHQAEAIQKTLAGRNVVVVTPTASGKTLCYNVPVLNTVLDPSGCARIVFVSDEGFGAGPNGRALPAHPAYGPRP